LKRKASIAAVALAIFVSGASAAEAAPTIGGSWPASVSTSGAVLWAEVNPVGAPASYRFEYTTEAAYLATGFANATSVPPGSEIGIPAGFSPVVVSRPVGGLAAGATYRFRVVVNSGGESFPGPTRSLTTGTTGQPIVLPDSRGWEMVSPVDKNGGEIQPVGSIFGGGVLQAASGGGEITYSSSYSFGDPQGAPGGSQYVSRRGASSWETENITAPGLSGTYPESSTSGVPYQLFSPDLGEALLSNGRRCRSAATTQCPVENPPLAGSGAPAGYRNYYRRDNGDGSFEAILTSGDVGDLALAAEDFELELAGATPDLTHVVLSTCAALTPDAEEVAGSEGECDPDETNLYEKSGSALRLLNLEPSASTGTTGATLAAQSRAISADGTRVYWTLEGGLYLRDGSVTRSISGNQAALPEFATASVNGGVAFFTEAGHLFRYAAGGSATDLTPGGGVLGVLGASDDGAYVYYAAASGLFLWRSGATSNAIAPAVEPDSYSPPAGTGTARVAADGRHLVFVSSSPGLAGYENRNAKTGAPEAEVYRYTAPPSGAQGGSLVCASCRISGERPLAGAEIPGASFNGIGTNLPHTYKPRVLSADANRVFFDSLDALVAQDTNNDRDVYQWEAQGSGTCARPSGCVNLISSGRAEGGASFVDASADGDDTFFLTDGSLVPSDPGSVDLYDARAGGGFPQPESKIPCFGDACQPLPAEPEDPTPGTLRAGRANPPAALPKRVKCKKGYVKRKGKCRKKHNKRKHRSDGGRR
jgi:hypothetical protein